MFRQQALSPTAQALSKLLAELKSHPEVELVALSTADGLVVDGESSPQLSAAAGFVLAAAQHTFGMLGLEKCQEVVLCQTNHSQMVSKLFQVGTASLILTVIFNRSVSNKRLLSNYIKQIQTLMEE